MIQTDSFSLINRISALRPKAYICVFSDDPKMKHGTALNFGVYCFPKKFDGKLSEFLTDHGSRFLLKKATAIHISTDTKGSIQKIFYDIKSSA
jgi:pyruvate kinase